MTTKAEVQSFRVRSLLRLQDDVGQEPAITALLSCYKLYQPQLISLVISSNRKRWFPAQDHLWSSRIQAAQQQFNPAAKIKLTKSLDDSEVFSPGVATAIATGAKQGSKRSRTDSGIPRVTSIFAASGASLSLQQVSHPTIAVA